MSGFRFIKHIFTVLIIVIVCGFMAVVYKGAAEGKPSTLSGRVVGTNGEPIAEAPIVLLYVRTAGNGDIDTLYDRSLYPFLHQRPARFPQELKGKTPDEAELQARPPFLESKTDSEGRFTFTDIATGIAQIMVLTREKDPATPHPVPQNVKPVPQIQTIKFGKVTFHPHDFPFFPPIGAVTFAIKPGSDIKDVEVVIQNQSKLKIQGRLVFKNGEPLADTTLKFDIGHLDLDLDGARDSVFSRSLHTDADGNFVSAVSVLGTYALSVNYRGLSAMSAPFTVEANKPHEAVVLTLNGNPADLSELSFDVPEERRYGVPDVPGVWIVNPANGHAYKWVECEDQADAQAKADDEGAHLVTITSEAEQIWIETVFGTGPHWIGLTDVLKEGEWIWETGEPVTYTNWGEEEEENVLDEPPALLKAFGAKGDRQRRDEEMKDYAIMSSRWGEEMIGKWYPADSKGAGRHGRGQMAIIEKDGTRSKIYGLSLPDSTPEDQ